jgi:hypothetical protein
MDISGHGHGSEGGEQEDGDIPSVQGCVAAYTLARAEPEKHEQRFAMENLTVCITSFKRPTYLRRALESCVKAGVTKIVVFSMEPDTAIVEVMNGFPKVRFESMPWDLGCNELWLQAAYLADTERVLILHDDDLLAPEFGDTYRSVIVPALSSGAGFASWRGNLMYDDGKIRPVEYFDGPTRTLPSSELEAVVSKMGRLSLSPVVSVFNRTTLIHALKEAALELPFLRPGMTLGTEILVYLRHCADFKRWLYVDEVLSHYGSHEGSGTIQAEKTSIAPLVSGYDFTRKYFTNHRNNGVCHESRILLVSAPFESKDEDEKRRIAAAQVTWDFQFQHGWMMNFAFHTPEIPRLKELLDFGVRHAMPEDIVAYANMDLAFVTGLSLLVETCVAEHGVCVAWRRTMPFRAGQWFSTCRNGNKDGGVDLVAVSPKWWKEHRDNIPDMFVASNFWDYVFRIYAESVTSGKCYIEDGTYHAPHPSFYSRHGLKPATQQHNRQLAMKFFNERGMSAAAKHIERYGI